MNFESLGQELDLSIQRIELIRTELGKVNVEFDEATLRAVAAIMKESKLSPARGVAVYVKNTEKQQGPDLPGKPSQLGIVELAEKLGESFGEQQVHLYKESFDRGNAKAIAKAATWMVSGGAFADPNSATMQVVGQLGVFSQLKNEGNQSLDIHQLVLEEAVNTSLPLSFAALLMPSKEAQNQPSLEPSLTTATPESH